MKRSAATQAFLAKARRRGRACRRAMSQAQGLRKQSYPSIDPHPDGSQPEITSKLQVENLALRHQIEILKRTASKRDNLGNGRAGMPWTSGTAPHPVKSPHLYAAIWPGFSPQLTNPTHRPQSIYWRDPSGAKNSVAWDLRVSRRRCPKNSRLHWDDACFARRREDPVVPALEPDTSNQKPVNFSAGRGHEVDRVRQTAV